MGTIIGIPAGYTRGGAAGLLAAALGAPTMAKWLAGWSSNEIQCGVGCRHPQNNLWACGQAAPGATDWNSAGVKNYPSLSEGIAATVANLNDPKYPAYQAMIHDLQQGIEDSTNIRAGLSTWCGSTCYSGSAGQFAAQGAAHFNDPFDDSSSGGSIVAPPSTPVPPQQSNATCGSSNAGSCQACSGLGIGTCPTDQVCVVFNADGSVYDAPVAPGLNNGVCVTNAYYKAHKTAPTPFSLPAALGLNWSGDRVLKWGIGALLIVFAVVIIGAVLLDKTASNPVVQQATKLAAIGA